MIAVTLAVLAAVSNALASVLQRHAARTAPANRTSPLGLMRYLIRRPVWLYGIGALIAGFLFQVAALSQAGLALVQPILVTELPFTMIFIAWLFRIRLGTESWLAIGALTVGLVVLLVAAGPTEGDRLPHRAGWAIATVVTIGVIGGLVAFAAILRGEGRAVVLGVAAGLGFAFTAALMKEATKVLAEDPYSLLTSWPAYAMVAAGLCSLLLLQYALRSGTLVAVQPALNVSDPVASIAYGVGLFGEEIRLEAWAVPEVVGVGLILYGSIRLAQSPPLRRHEPVTPPPET
ncbi:DMT family transporter [Actinomadura alba]|uniref:DMT family transporter n=1 Tax=Actinomadura alba TaxID=406431 RepID=A0ABR7LSF0_9ACTN|nr:DMT family transporter [Actinomadura alba]MBC6467457.1 DMT family transporter [Actinomadura alba]